MVDNFIMRALSASKVLHYIKWCIVDNNTSKNVAQQNLEQLIRGIFLNDEGTNPYISEICCYRKLYVHLKCFCHLILNAIKIMTQRQLHDSSPTCQSQVLL